MVMEMLEEMMNEEKLDGEYLGKIMVNALVFTKELMEILPEEKFKDG